MRRSRAAKNVLVKYGLSSDSSDDDEVPALKRLNNSAECYSYASDSVAAIVRAIIFRDQCKEPFSKAEIIKLALKKRKVETRIWLEAEKRLLDTFGLLIKPLQAPLEHHMILIKNNASSISLSAISDPQMNPSNHDGILAVILGSIFMSKESMMDQAELMTMMKKLDVTESTEIVMPNDSDSSVSFKYALHTLWKKQLYIEIEERADVGKRFKWGQRAHIEVPKPKVLDWMAKILEKQPEDFKEQYFKAYGRRVTRLSLTINLPTSCEEIADEEVQVASPSPPLAVLDERWSTTEEEFSF